MELKEAMPNHPTRPPETVYEQRCGPKLTISEGAIGAIALGSSRRFRTTERELSKRSLSRDMARNVFDALFDCFRRRRRLHCVGLVDTIQNHRTRASEMYFEPRYDPKLIAGSAGTEIIYYCV